jgi:hypothetical protein
VRLETLKPLLVRLPEGDIRLLPGTASEVPDQYAARLLNDRPQVVRRVDPHECTEKQRVPPFPRLIDLTHEQQCYVMARYSFSAAVFCALATGRWNDQTLQDFWGTPRPTGIHIPDEGSPVTDDSPILPVVAPRLPKLTRSTVEVHTVNGSETVSAWLAGGLAIHRSVAICGWTVSHACTGRRIVSGIGRKEKAEDLVTRLLELDLDWWSPDPIPRTHMNAVLDLLRTVSVFPRRRRQQKTDAKE